jgi:hypothetical protein
MGHPGDDAAPAEASSQEERQENELLLPAEETPQEVSPSLSLGSVDPAHLELPEAKGSSSAPRVDIGAPETESEAIKGTPEHAQSSPRAEDPERPKTELLDQQDGRDADPPEDPWALGSLD